MANTKVTTRVIADDAITSDKLASGLTLGGDTTLSGHVALADSKEIRLGNAPDAKIYHNGTHLYIDEADAGRIFIRSSDEVRLNKYTGEFMVRAIADGAVTLYHDNSPKIATNSGGITVTGTATATTFSGALSGSIASATTATTQSASDNSTKVATTAYVDGAISDLVDSSPSALNTLNELAAALGDDANFSTTVTNSIATKLPLAGGTMTGALVVTANANPSLEVSRGSANTTNVNLKYNTTLTGQLSAANEKFQISAAGSGTEMEFYTAGVKALEIDTSQNATLAGGFTGTSATFTDDVAINNGSPELYFGTTGNHYNWRIAAQEVVDAGLEVAVGSQDTNYADDTYTTIFCFQNNGSMQLGYSGAGRQQADSQAFTITTPASGGGQGIALKRLDSNTDQQLGEISWSNNTQDGQANIRVKTEGAVNTTDMLFDVNNAGTLVNALRLDGSAGGAARFYNDVGVTQSDGDYVARLYVSSADGFLDLNTGNATPITRTRISSYGRSFINENSGGLNATDGRAALSVGANTNQKAGKLVVYGGSSTGTNGGILHYNGTSRQYNNVVSHQTAAAAARWWNIKTNIQASNFVMYVAHVHGYSYGNSGAVVDIYRSGYAHTSTGTFSGANTQNNGSSTDTLDHYYSSDGYVVFKHTTPSSGYYNGYTFSIGMFSPTGYNFNFEILAHTFATSSTNAY
jgi:hypothetical protein